MVVFISFRDYDFPNLIKTGVVGGVLGQYISDLFFNTFVYEKRNFISIITDISPIPSYIAATSAGFINGLTEPYIDDITSAGLRNVVYSYTNNYYSIKAGLRDASDTLRAIDVVGDTIAIIILVWAFNIHARKDYYNHKAKMHSMPQPFEDQNDILSSTLIVIVTNFYAYYKLTMNQTSFVDRGVDLINN